MLELKFEQLDWILIRQALSLSLFKLRAVKICGGYSFLENNSRYKPIFADIEKFIKQLHAGELIIDNDSILYNPETVNPGIYNIDTGNYSSSVEIILFALPAFLSKNFRTILNIKGVTHSNLSYPTSFVKETLFSILEKSGLYCSMTLKRFGFYGSGGGDIEARIYPMELKAADYFSGSSEISITSARIYISGLSSDIAKKQKDIIGERLSLPEKSVSILEIMDSNGFGNVAQITIQYVDLSLILFRVIDIYNDAGDFIFDEENNIIKLHELINEAEQVITNNIIPDYIIRECLPFSFLSNSRMIYDKKKNFINSTEQLCTHFFG